MKAVLLAGGLGTRMREETEFRPKPMVEIGGRPILWHIMRMLGTQGLTDFVVCAGYKGEQIKDYFLNYSVRSEDFTVSLGRTPGVTFHGGADEVDWSVTVSDTGPLTMTGGRIRRIEKFVEGERFLCTYGDGLASIDLSALTAFHEGHGRIATVTTYQPTSRFGVLDLDEQRLVRRFREKPRSEDWINIGYFIFEPEIFDYLEDDETVLEQEPLRRLAEAGQLAAYPHSGFWQPMDTYRESRELNDLWDAGKAPWRNW